MHKNKLLIYLSLVSLIGAGLLIYWAPQYAEWLHQHQWILQTLHWVPLFLLALVGFLGLRYNQWGLLWAVGCISLGYILLTRTTVHMRSWETQWMLFLFHLNLLWAWKQMPRKIFSMAWLSSSLWLIGQVAVTGALVWAQRQGMPWILRLVRELQTFSYWPEGPFSNGLLGGCLLVILVWCVILIFDHQAESLGFWGVTLAVNFAIAAEPSSLALPIFTAVAVGILGIMKLETAYQMAFLDELTGLPGRRSLNQTLLNLGKRYAIAMIDIDHFKKFNDTYGHDTGDQVLQMVAAEMQKIRGGGKCYRYGGEEFTVIFSRRNAKEAKPFMEAFRERLADHPFVVRNTAKRTKKSAKNRQASTSQKKVQVTVSIGIADPGNKRYAPEEVIKQADKKLYKAKENGRNQVVV